MQALSLDPTPATDQSRPSSSSSQSQTKRNPENDWFFEIFPPDDEGMLVDCD